MSYKTDIEKGFKLLHCLSPPIIVVNDPFKVDPSFVKQFKENGYSVFSDNNKEKIKSYLDSRKSRFDHQTLVISTQLNDPEQLSQLLPEEYLFTLVLLYPNDSKKYRDLLKKQITVDPLVSNLSVFNMTVSNLSTADPLMEEITAILKEIKELDPKQTSNPSLLNKLTVKMMAHNKEIYQKFLDYFEEKFLTVLI